MKVAVCVSGAITSRDPNLDFSSNMDRLSSFFPNADMFYATWTDEPTSLLPDKELMLVEQPSNLYNTFLDVPRDEVMSPHFDKSMAINGKKLSRAMNATKQHWIHAKLLDSLPHEYDMIVRTRFDITVKSGADFSSYLAESYDNSIAIGFAGLKNHDPVEMCKKRKPGYIADMLIMHPRSLYDTQLVYKLFDEKRIPSGEYGWFRLLSEPFGDTHKNISGLCNFKA